MRRIVLLTSLLLSMAAFVTGQTKPFIPVEGATLKAKIESAVLQGRNNSSSGVSGLVISLKSDQE